MPLARLLAIDPTEQGGSVTCAGDFMFINDHFWDLVFAIMGTWDR